MALGGRHSCCLTPRQSDLTHCRRLGHVAAHSLGGSMQNRKGFTLIELLIVVVIIGILAAIAIPKFANTKEKAVVAGMKSDLRNLVTAQEGFFSDNQTYATGFAATQTNAAASPTCGGNVASPRPPATCWRSPRPVPRLVGRPPSRTRPSRAPRTTSAASSWAIRRRSPRPRVWPPRTTRAPRSATELELSGTCSAGAAAIRRPVFLPPSTPVPVV